MPVDTSIYSMVQPRQQSADPMEQFGRMMQIKNLLQSNQAGNMQMQQEQMKLDQMKQDFRDESAARDILSQAGGDIERAKPLLLKTLGAKALPIFTKIAEQEKAIAGLDTEKAKVAKERLSIFNSTIDNIESLPIEQRPQAYQQSMQMLISQGLLSQEMMQNIPPVYDSELLQGYGDHLKRTLADIDLKTKQAGLRKAGAEATTAEQRAEGRLPIQPEEQAKIDKPSTADQKDADVLALGASKLGKSVNDLTPQERAKIRQDYEVQTYGGKMSQVPGQIIITTDQYGRPVSQYNKATGQQEEIGGVPGYMRTPSLEEKKMNRNAMSGIEAIDKIEELLKSDPNVIKKGAVPGSPFARTFDRARKEAIDVLTRMRTGAALNAEEQKFYESYVPTLLDLTDREAIGYKLTQLRKFYNSFLLPGAGKDTTSPKSQPKQPAGKPKSDPLGLF